MLCLNLLCVGLRVDSSNFNCVRMNRHTMIMSMRMIFFCLTRVWSVDDGSIIW